jgi:hypothetical protein
MFIVWKSDFEVRNEGLTDLRSEKGLTQAGEWKPRRVSGRNSNVAV